MIEQAEAGVCPVCAGMTVDDVCPWAYQSQDSVDQAYGLDALDGEYAPSWVECVLMHVVEEG